MNYLTFALLISAQISLALLLIFWIRDRWARTPNTAGFWRRGELSSRTRKMWGISLALTIGLFLVSTYMKGNMIAAKPAASVITKTTPNERR